MCGGSCAVKRQVLDPTASSGASTYEATSRIFELSVFLMLLLFMEFKVY